MPIDITKLTVEELIDLKFQLSKIKIGNPSEANGHISIAAIKCEGWDWTKTNGELAKEHGVLYQTVRQRRIKLGHQPVTKYWPACKNWDWTKSDTEISRSTGATITGIRGYRLRLNRPTVAPQYDTLPEFKPKFDYGSLDWSKPDIQIARETGRTRERIRQVRAELGKPKSHFTFHKFNQVKAILEANPEATFEEVSALVKVSRCTFLKYLRRLGIHRDAIYQERHIPWSQMNWNLPNKLLGEIWSFKSQKFAARRCNHHLQKPLFVYRCKMIPEEFASIVQTEREKAKAHFEKK